MDCGSSKIGSDTGLLVEDMKGLQLLSSSSPSSSLSPTPSPPASSVSTVASSNFGDLLAASRPPDHLDSFLHEALNSRNRITVLRLEQEIEKFAGNPRQQQLLLKPMVSSYDRLAAHRVAHYYHLQSMAIESDGPSGSRILLLKILDSKMPSVRLVDIPVDLTPNEKSTSPSLEKVAIKQRKSGSFSNKDAPSAQKMTPLKSVKERTEEYNKARARIFNNGNLENRKDSGAGVEDQHVAGELLVSREAMSIGAERDNHEEDAAFRAAHKVAVFRDREKDIKDPDYDRSYDRYSPPLKTATNVIKPPITNAVCCTSNDTLCQPIVTHGVSCASNGHLCQPLVTHGVCCVSNGDSCQGEMGNLQMRVDSALYPASDTQNGRWVGATDVPVLGYPCAMPCTPGGHSLSNMYLLPTQKLVHPGYHNFANWHQLPVPHLMPSTRVPEWFRSY